MSTVPELAKILEFQDASGEMLALRLPGSADGVIEWGSQLIVREGQTALFFRDGRAMASFEAGRHVLTSQNVAGLTKLVTGLVYGSGNTPFRAEVIFVGRQLCRDLRWGTPEPVYIPDPVLLQIPVRANGRFAIRVSDPSLFVPKVVGTRPFFRSRDIEDFLRSQYLVAALTDALASLAKPFAELPRYYRDLGIGVKALLQAEFQTLGLELTELSVNSVSTTEEIQQTLNRNAGIASEAHARARGTELDLEARARGAAALGQAGTSYQQVGMTEAMKTLAEKAGDGERGGPMATGLDLGMALMVPQMMGNMLKDNPAVQPPQAAGAGDPVTRLKQLKELLDLGAVTQEEFDAKKVELLKLI